MGGENEDKKRMRGFILKFQQEFCVKSEKAPIQLNLCVRSLISFHTYFFLRFLLFLLRFSPCAIFLCEIKTKSHKPAAESGNFEVFYEFSLIVK